jgi:hypothetical protein
MSLLHRRKNTKELKARVFADAEAPRESSKDF